MHRYNYKIKLICIVVLWCGVVLVVEPVTTAAVEYICALLYTTSISTPHGQIGQRWEGCREVWKTGGGREEEGLEDRGREGVGKTMGVSNI